jgi:hypothetical protein
MALVGHQDHLDDLTKKKMVDAVGMGNMVGNLCILSFTWGLNYTVETLISQASGSKLS